MTINPPKSSHQLCLHPWHPKLFQQKIKVMKSSFERYLFTLFICFDFEFNCNCGSCINHPEGRLLAMICKPTYLHTLLIFLAVIFSQDLLFLAEINIQHVFP